MKLLYLQDSQRFQGHQDFKVTSRSRLNVPKMLTKIVCVGNIKAIRTDYQELSYLQDTVNNELVFKVRKFMGECIQDFDQENMCM